MRLGLSILGIVLAAIVGFTGLAMVESWEEVFGPFFAGVPSAAPAPPKTAVEAALRAYNDSLQRGETVGAERTPARRMAELERSFLGRYGVSQALTLRELEVLEVRVTGPGVYTADVREHSELTISRTLTPPRHYRVSGTWEYLLRGEPSELQVVDVKPKEVQLAEPEAAAAPGGEPDSGGAP